MKKCFTLIELLVVVAIIGILASILLPSLNMAKERGKKISCASKMRQMAQAVTLYCADNQDYWIIQGSNDDKETCWPLRLARGGYPGRRLPAGAPYGDIVKVMRNLWNCPNDTFPVQSGDSQDPDPANRRSYGINICTGSNMNGAGHKHDGPSCSGPQYEAIGIRGGTADRSVKIGSIKRPDILIAVSEFPNNRHMVRETSIGHASSQVLPAKDPARRLHPKFYGYIMMDGHLADIEPFMTMSPWERDPLYTATRPTGMWIRCSVNGF